MNPLALARVTWKTTDFPLCRLNIRLSNLARSLEFQVATWVEDGIGETHGFACQIPSGRTLLISEHPHAIAHLNGKGPEVYVDASDLISDDIETVLADVLSGLQITRDALEWQQPNSAVENARLLCRQIEQRKSGAQK